MLHHATRHFPPTVLRTDTTLKLSLVLRQVIPTVGDYQGSLATAPWSLSQKLIWPTLTDPLYPAR